MLLSEALVFGLHSQGGFQALRFYELRVWHWCVGAELFWGPIARN